MFPVTIRYICGLRLGLETRGQCSSTTFYYHFFQHTGISGRTISLHPLPKIVGAAFSKLVEEGLETLFLIKSSNINRSSPESRHLGLTH
jgi:hypothetical protein